jgi:cyclase
MRKVRVIPTILLDGNGLVKPQKFSNPKYIGDPRNAVKIFNEKEVDELILIDIYATKRSQSPNFSLIKEIASECFMPMGYGGGIHSVTNAEMLFKCGVEKIILNSEVVIKPDIIKELSNRYGTQAIVVSIDVKKNLFGKYSIYIENGQKNTKMDPVDFAKRCEEFGAGEVYLTAIDREGMMEGYDIELTKMVAKSINIPVIASGGAGSITHMAKVVKEGFASAVTAGSMFVFHGKLRGVLINFPNQDILERELYNTI